MDRYLKVIFILLVFILTTNLLKSQIRSDSVYYYLKNDDKFNENGCSSMKIIIYNGSNDSICITNFNKYDTHYSDMNFRRVHQNVFYWNLLTLSNKEPDNILNVTPFAPHIKNCMKKYDEKTVNIVIHRNETFVSDIQLIKSLFVVYTKGFYKLCLYSKENNRCVASTIIDIK